MHNLRAEVKIAARAGINPNPEIGPFLGCLQMSLDGILGAQKELDEDHSMSVERCNPKIILHHRPSYLGWPIKRDQQIMALR